MPMCGTPKPPHAGEPSYLKSSDRRVVRYRRLALAACDNVTAQLLHSLADEAERGVLCTADWLKAVVPRRRKAAEL